MCIFYIKHSLYLHLDDDENILNTLFSKVFLFKLKVIVYIIF